MINRKRTKFKKVIVSTVGERLFTDIGGIGFYKVIWVKKCKEYCKNAETPDGLHWFDIMITKIKSENGVVYIMPYLDLMLKSTYASTGELVLKR